MPAVPAGSPAGACPGQKGHVPAPGTGSPALRYGHGRLVRHARHRPSARGIVAARLPAARQPSQAGLAFPRALCHIYACRAEACRHRCGARSSKPVAGLTVCGRFDSYTPPPLPQTSRPQASCPRTFFVPSCPGMPETDGLQRSPAPLPQGIGVPSAHCLLSACRASSDHVAPPILFPVAAPAAGGLPFPVQLRPVFCRAASRIAGGPPAGGRRPGPHGGFPPSGRA